MKRIVGILCISLLVACQPPELSEEETTTPPVQNANYYTEQHRPQYHFTPPQQWMNDPNGMVYLDGEYHLFYQHYPDSNVWGPMHWGHAISTDLLHWEHLPIALYPDSLGLIFSGSAVYDADNTSGLGTADNPPLVALFTHHNMEGEQAGRDDFQVQSIAYSTDRGRTWTKYPGNPVIPNTGIRDFRDPKVTWDAASNQWVMVLAAKDEIHFYGSPNLIDWNFLSAFGKNAGSHEGVWECPDFFTMQATNDGTAQYVLLVSVQAGSPNGGTGQQYFVGSFDGTFFSLENRQSPTDTLWMDYGRDNYAGVTWSNMPEADGRRILLGWMSNWQYATVVPTYDWRSAMTIPRRLELENRPEGYRMQVRPVAELQDLRANEYPIAAQTITDSLVLENADFDPSVSEFQLQFELASSTASRFGIRLYNPAGECITVGYDRDRNAYFTDRRQSGNVDFMEAFATDVHYAPRVSESETIGLHLFFDKSSLELFTDDYFTVMTDIFFPNADFQEVMLFAEQGEVQLVEGQYWTLAGVWR